MRGSLMPETETPATPDQAREIERLRAELAATRAALADAEQRLLELRDWRSTELGRLERQVHWIERSRVDLDRLMSRRSVKLLVRIRQLALRLRGFVRALRRR